MSEKQTLNEMSFTFRDVVYHLFRFRRPALLAMLVVVAVGVALTVLTKERYEAKAKLFLDMNINDLSLLRQDNPSVRLNLEELIFTEVEALKSWRRSGPVLDSLRARHVPIPQNVGEEALAMVAVPVRKSSFIDVSLQAGTAEFAQAYLAEVLRQYAAQRNTVRDGDQQILHYQKSLQEYDGKVAALEQELADFQREHDIVLIDAQVRNRLNTLERLKTDRLGLDRDVRERRSELSSLERLKASFDPGLITQDILGRFPQLRSVQADYTNLNSELAELLQIYNDDHPDVVRLKGRIELQRRNMEDVLDHQLEYASQELRLREEDMREVMSNIHQYEKRLVELSSVERDFDGRVKALSDLQELRTTVLRKLEEMKLQQIQNGAFKLEVLGDAVASSSPVEPKVLFNALLTVFFALGLGLLIPLYKWKVDDTIVTEADAERITGLPTLGGVREER